MGGVVAANEMGSYSDGIIFVQCGVGGGDGWFGHSEGMNHIAKIDDADGAIFINEQVVIVPVVVDNLGAKAGEMGENGRYRRRRWRRARRCGRGSIIRVLEKSYSVPTSLIGKMVTVYVHEWSLEIYYAGQVVETVTRLIGKEVHRINYRHVIDSLLRKPGGFRRYRYRDDLFPSLVFRQGWEALQAWYAPRRADLAYLQVLQLAAKQLECDVAIALELLVAAGKKWDETDVAALLAVEAAAIPMMEKLTADLDDYDRLLTGVVV